MYRELKKQLGWLVQACTTDVLHEITGGKPKKKKKEGGKSGGARFNSHYHLHRHYHFHLKGGRPRRDAQ
jgi:hypothetical protein